MDECAERWGVVNRRTACRVHKNGERGESGAANGREVARMLLVFESGTQESGNCVVLVA